ncbi:FAD-dependent oxidoreductase [Weissella halotolerans]|uniref:Alpha-glycerophosphate oxidase n=1 Tax=Weissella halotolerans DSM 20190 TaxID=1123500 RepID=A0A0R2FZC3_9LACO|nr:FAD-dependent oxidoreductase [Weissella halotolerans]KRN33544.1 glycerol-3-phosphate dehydrogenase [Weissella halotolerans DSM 20190]
MQKFSSKQRTDYITRLNNTSFDVLIIGGGITGAGVALQAAAGLKTAIIDMQDFAEGTSSRSTKLVHGGIRYLKTFDVDVVADTVRERARIQHIAPHIPRPTMMLMPLYQDQDATFTPMSAEVAMTIYDKLAGVLPHSPFVHHLFPKEEALQQLPQLNQQNLVGLATYLDYLNNDARLTIENIKQAVDDGATAVSQLKAIKIQNVEEGNVVTVKDSINQQTFDIKAKVVVNAAGPWIDQLKDLTGTKKTAHKIRPTKGIHLVIDNHKLSVANTIYFDSGYHDGRMIFVIPRGNKTYFGTTDTDYHGDYQHPQVDQSDVDYLLQSINAHFPDANLSLADIEASWAGIRPLIGKGDYNGGQAPTSLTDTDLKTLQAMLNQYFNGTKKRRVVETLLATLTGDQQAASKVSRGFEIEVNQGMVTIAGGKITDYRLMAAEAMKAIATYLANHFKQSVTLIDSTQYPVSGGHFDSTKVDTVLAVYAKHFIDLGLSVTEAQALANLYGSNSPVVASYIESGQVAPGLSLAETSMLHYALDYEMVNRPIDYLLRRTNYVLFQAQDTDRIEQAVIDEMARQLVWDQATKQTMQDEYYRLRRESQLTVLKERKSLDD